MLALERGLLERTADYDTQFVVKATRKDIVEVEDRMMQALTACNRDGPSSRESFKVPQSPARKVIQMLALELRIAKA